jgi:hypothetical protein
MACLFAFAIFAKAFFWAVFKSEILFSNPFFRVWSSCLCSWTTPCVSFPAVFLSIGIPQEPHLAGDRTVPPFKVNDYRQTF